MKAASLHFRKALAALEKGPAHPGMEAMRQELQKSISAAEQAVWSAQPGEVKRRCTVEALASLQREEAECEASMTKLSAQMEALVARRGRVRQDISDNQCALATIEAGLLAADDDHYGWKREEPDDWMDRDDDGYYGWYSGWRDDHGVRQDGYGGQRPPYTGQFAQAAEDSYLEQLQKLYLRLGSEATQESLAQAAQLTTHFAVRVSELLAAATPAPVTPLRQLALPTGSAPSTDLCVAQLVPPSPSPARSSITVATPTPAGRKVKDGKEKLKAGKLKSKDSKEKRVSLAAAAEGSSSDDEEDMVADGAATAGLLDGEADGSAALGFRPAAGVAAAP